MVLPILGSPGSAVASPELAANGAGLAASLTGGGPPWSPSKLDGSAGGSGVCSSDRTIGSNSGETSATGLVSTEWGSSQLLAEPPAGVARRAIRLDGVSGCAAATGAGSAGGGSLAAAASD